MSFLYKMGIPSSHCCFVPQRVLAGTLSWSREETPAQPVSRAGLCTPRKACDHLVTKGEPLLPLAAIFRLISGARGRDPGVDMCIHISTLILGREKMNRTGRKCTHLHVCIVEIDDTHVHTGKELKERAFRAVENRDQMMTGAAH